MSIFIWFSGKLSPAAKPFIAVQWRNDPELCSQCLEVFMCSLIYKSGICHLFINIYFACSCCDSKSLPENFHALLYGTDRLY
jgi:hypothetical protein